MSMMHGMLHERKSRPDRRTGQHGSGLVETSHEKCPVPCTAAIYGTACCLATREVRWDEQRAQRQRQRSGERTVEGAGTSVQTALAWLQRSAVLLRGLRRSWETGRLG